MNARSIRVFASVLCLLALVAFAYARLRPAAPSVLLELRLQLVDGGTALLGPSPVVHSGEQLRFEVKVSSPSEVFVLGLDENGQVSLYVPSSGAATRVPAGARTLLPDHINVDGALGRERVLALACPQGTDVGGLVAEVQRALTAADNHPEKVSALRTTCSRAWYPLTRAVQTAVKSPAP